MVQDKIEYVLIARINNQQVFYARYEDTYALQEVGLNDAEDAVSMYLDSDDLEPEELSYIHHMEDKTKLKKFKGDKDE